MSDNALYYLAVSIWSVILCIALAILYAEVVGNFPSTAQLVAMGFLSVIMVWLSENA